MVTEAIMINVIKIIALFVKPVFDSVYSSLGIRSGTVIFSIPSPLMFIVETFGGYALVVLPFAVAWWCWRQVKA